MVKVNEAGRTTYETPSDVELVITRVFDAPRLSVWKAYTEPEHLRAWMLGPEGWSMPVCEMDLRPGGTIRWVWRQAAGQEMAITGTVREVVPPSRLVHVESWGPTWDDTHNTLELTEEGGQTRAVTTIRYPSKKARDEALASGMKEGMALSFDRLAAHLDAVG